MSKNDRAEIAARQGEAGEWIAWGLIAVGVIIALYSISYALSVVDVRISGDWGAAIAGAWTRAGW